MVKTNIAALISSAKITTALIFAVIILLFVVAVFIYYTFQPSISLRTSVAKENGVMEFEITSRNIHVLDAIHFWRDNKLSKEYVWILIRSDSTTNIVVNYGIIPEGLKQNYPLNAISPEPLAPGDLLYINIVYQYNTMFPPDAASSNKVFLCEIGANGSVINHGEVHSYKYPVHPSKIPG